MTILVKLTEKSGNPVYIQPCNVTMIKIMDDPGYVPDVQNLTVICTQNERIIVTEPIEQVVKLFEYERNEI